MDGWMDGYVNISIYIYIYKHIQDTHIHFHTSLSGPLPVHQSSQYKCQRIRPQHSSQSSLCMQGGLNTTRSLFVTGSPLQKRVCISQAVRHSPLSASHSSAEAAPFSGEETTPSPVQTPVISSNLPMTFTREEKTRTPWMETDSQSFADNALHCFHFCALGALPTLQVWRTFILIDIFMANSF